MKVRVDGRSDSFLHDWISYRPSDAESSFYGSESTTWVQ